MKQYLVTGMSCAACQARVEKAVNSLDGVDSCSVSILTNSMGVEGNVSSEEIIKAVEDAGYGASLKGASQRASISDEEDALVDRETPVLKKRLISSLIFLLLLMYLSMGHNMLGLPLPEMLEHNYVGLAISQMLLALIVMIINRKFFTSGFSSVIHLAPNMDTLVALGSSVAFGWSTYVLIRMTYYLTIGVGMWDLLPLYKGQLYFESSAMIPALITVGKLLESISKGKTTDALKGLMKLAPKTAILLKDNKETEVPIDDVSVGDIFVVKPGSNVPVDGIILDGSAAFDESALTGESLPVDKSVGDKVSAATVNKSGFVQCRATKVGEDTTLAQIIHLVSDAAATKAPISRIADKVSGIFVPAVIGIAFVVFVCWLIAGASYGAALERAICVLVISCPCALGLATPVAIMVGNGVGAKGGILFKTGEALETAGKIDIIALDKTGTITSGKPSVTDLIPAPGFEKDSLLEIAYALEAKSEHPLAIAINEEALKYKTELLKTKDFKSHTGNGLEATLDMGEDSPGILIHAGNANFISSFVHADINFSGIEKKLASGGKTPLFFEAGGRLVGIIGVADTLKKESANAIEQLHKLGNKVVMITGDNKMTAIAIGKKAGVDKVIAGVLPDGKADAIETLKEHGKVAMVGDGINDAPALTIADIGIAIGAGTDVAIDSADIVLMNSRLTDVPAAIRLSRATIRNIHQNLFWAFFYNAICIPLAAGVFNYWMSPMLGAAAMSISSFTVCMNALRLNFFDMKDSTKDKPRRKSRIYDIFTLTENPTVDSEDSNNNEHERSNTMEKTIKIEGMMCPHCEANVKGALEGLDGIDSAVVSHESGTAVITMSGDVADDVLQKTIEDKGYKFLGVE
ncbi:MAG: heavy metal translocating P-type ATPase [Lachnospiraceae bacterium]|nr:heavy metal translocating P-type ATPase [Lachnospiraceae bacterium]